MYKTGTTRQGKVACTAHYPNGKPKEHKELIEIPCKIGETVWVSPNNGMSFHTGTFLGFKANENDLEHIAYIVEVNDKELKFVDNPVSSKFIDYFCKVYTKEDIENIKK